MLEDTNQEVQAALKENIVEVFEDKYMSIFRLESLAAFEIKYSKEIYNSFNFQDAIEVMDQTIVEIKKQLQAGFKYDTILFNLLDGGPIATPQVQEFVATVFYPFFSKKGIQNKIYCSPETIIPILMKSTNDNTALNQENNHPFFTNREDSICHIKNTSIID
ncbi:hypothetical protein DNU06_07620 [Putridiphycobacter roseus]|uniref:Uncharacterized protein n=1 Tax=Putridiphycobacter roseus TaxID=2219161 RepID=A0A2W1MZN6_9FLAO|nr:hypothetical protein [Putridiphycobacter roseus]PZE17689.1 hypothetical protein DNU06_07620 [Putridiphycobacter roseus]